MRNSYCQPSFDDSKWRAVDVPHDFVVEGSFSRSADQAHGYLPFGVGWYRKHIDLPAHDADAVYELTLDGVQVRALVQSRVYVTALAVAEHGVGERSHAGPARFGLHVADLRYTPGALAGAQQRACCQSRCHAARQLVVRWWRHLSPRDSCHHHHSWPILPRQRPVLARSGLRANILVEWSPHRRRRLPI